MNSMTKSRTTTSSSTTRTNNLHTLQATGPGAQDVPCSGASWCVESLLRCKGDYPLGALAMFGEKIMKYTADSARLDVQPLSQLNRGHICHASIYLTPSWASSPLRLRNKDDICAGMRAIDHAKVNRIAAWVNP